MCNKISMIEIKGLFQILNLFTMKYIKRHWISSISANDTIFGLIAALPFAICCVAVRRNFRIPDLPCRPFALFLLSGLFTIFNDCNEYRKVEHIFQLFLVF